VEEEERLVFRNQLGVEAAKSG